MDESSLRYILKQLNIQVANKSGKWLEFCCPFAPWTHKRGTDNSPSCAVVIDIEKASHYKCHGCKKHGRVSSMIRSLEHFKETQYPGLAFEADLADAEYSLGDFEATEDEPDEIHPLNEALYANLYEPAWDVPEGRDYLKFRGISKATAKYLELGYDPDDYRIVFPVRGPDQLLYGFTGRSILRDEHFHLMYPKYQKVKDYLGLPKKHLLLGADLVDPKLPIFPVEGLFGYAHLMEIKADIYCNPVALLGSEMTQYKADMIIEWNRLTCILTDNDEAGDTCLFGTWNAQRAEHEGGGAVDKLKNHVPLIIPDWPEGKTDPDELTLAEVKAMLAEPLYRT